jgi:signal transduction histidine kinase
MAIEALDRQDSIVGDLLEAAQLEKGDRDAAASVGIDLAPVIDHVSDEFTPLITQNKLKIEIQVSKSLPVVKVDQKQLEHILRNLLSNAIKFNEKGGKISIAARKKGKFVEVSVADTGIGIPKNKLPKVFDRFYQADASTGRPFGGTGLGLSVVKEIIEMHSGEIGVESKSGKGSRFYFTLPIVKE